MFLTTTTYVALVPASTTLLAVSVTGPVTVPAAVVATRFDVLRFCEPLTNLYISRYAVAVVYHANTLSKFTVVKVVES